LLFLSRFRYLKNENTQKETKKFNYSDIIDIDPFGSPSKYIPVSFQSIEVGGILCLTATDTPALFGIWKESCIRKYLTKPIKCEFFKEMGTRILIYYAAKMAHLYEMHITPLLSISSDHFIRIFLMINRGIEGGNKNMKDFGKYVYCSKCGYRNFEKFNIKGSKYEDKSCPYCHNNKILRSGLVWMGKLHSEFYKNKLLEEVEKVSPKIFTSKNKIKKYLELSAREDENFPPYFYSIPKIADSINKAYPSMKKLQEKLNEIGFDVCRTHFDPQGLKTNADIRVIKEIINSFNN
jgi:tRNA (guanine26-N2/guanine27-N2)-dimethyltransferase